MGGGDDGDDGGEVTAHKARAQPFQALGVAVALQGHQAVEFGPFAVYLNQRDDDLAEFFRGAETRVLAEVVEAGFKAPHRFLRSEEHTSELQSRENLVCRLLLDKNNVRLNKSTTL